MVTRQERLVDFDGQGIPPIGVAIELLCEDHCGTYVIPFACRWVNGNWQTMASGEGISAKVVGWRKIQ